VVGNRAAPLLAALRDCVCEKVTAANGPVCWCGLYPGGLPVWDYCGNCGGETCGMIYVSVARIEPYTSFGVGAQTGTCGSGLQAVVNIGTARCLPIEEDGALPGEEAMAEAVWTLHADAYAIREAVSCCTPADTILTGYTLLPAQGGCVGGQWGVILDLE
jgi:hypothetical protein